MFFSQPLGRVRLPYLYCVVKLLKIFGLRANMNRRGIVLATLRSANKVLAWEYGAARPIDWTKRGIEKLGVAPLPPPAVFTDAMVDVTMVDATLDAMLDATMVQGVKSISSNFNWHAKSDGFKQEQKLVVYIYLRICRAIRVQQAVQHGCSSTAGATLALSGVLVDSPGLRSTSKIKHLLYIT